jgi:hypothetical protein
MWNVKKSAAAKRRANKLFGDQKFDFTKSEDRKKFGLNYLEWNLNNAS